jgi:hypothetical protein
MKVLDINGFEHICVNLSAVKAWKVWVQTTSNAIILDIPTLDSITIFKSFKPLPANILKAIREEIECYIDILIRKGDLSILELTAKIDKQTLDWSLELKHRGDYLYRTVNDVVITQLYIDKLLESQSQQEEKQDDRPRT